MGRIRKKQCAAFTALEAVVLVCLVVLLAAIAIPNFVRDPCTSPANACINNLRQIDAAANQFALQNNLKTGDKINFPNDLTPYIKLDPKGKIPRCPGGGIYQLKMAGKLPTCSLGDTVTPSHVLTE